MDSSSGSPVASASASATPSAATARATRTTIYEPDRFGKPPNLRYQFSAARSAAILAPLFPKRFASPRQCGAAKPTLDDARKNGEVAPVVLAEIDGSFTRSGAQQVLDLIAVNECGDPIGTTAFAVFEGAELVSHGAFPVDAIIAAKVDPDSDGRDELLLAYQWDAHGTHGVTAKLGRIDDSTLSVTRTLGEVFRDACPSTAEQRRRVSGRVVLIERAGHPGDLVVERTAPSACND
ncbi:MAG: hypothetical protein KF850_11170 [Labilithrix sp.]|nr:hypothetical protein [Labilithrix sp.]